MPKVDVQRPKTLRGMDYTRRADLISPEQWREQFNMRLKETKLTQVPRKVFAYGTYVQEPILHLATLPSSMNPGYGKMVALSESSVFRLGASSATGIASNLNTSNEFMRWATFKNGGRLYFCNPANSVAWTDGVSFEQYSNTPRAYHMTVDNFHMILGAFEWNGKTHRSGVAWSHGRDFSSFLSSSSLEGDYWASLDEYQRDGETVDGVTGLATMSGVTLVFTSSMVYTMRYVEGEKTYRIDPMLQDKGCGLRYGLAQIGIGCIFPDMVEKNFFMVQGPGADATEVGDAIKDYFFSDLNSTPELAQRTYVEVDNENKEVRWVYVSGASVGDYDRAAVLSWRDMGWSIHSIEATNCFSRGIRLSKSVADTTGTNSAQTGTNLSAGRSSDVIPALWGTKDGMLLREEVAGDALSVLVEQPLPYLMTGDFVYDDLVKVKEIDGVVFHGTWTNASLMKVEVATRNNLDAGISWVGYGTWDKDSGLFRASLNARISGRIIRFRFTPITTGAASASTKDFSSGVDLLPTPSTSYNSFQHWNVTGTWIAHGSGTFVANYVALFGSNANGTLYDYLPGNGVYVLGFDDVNLSNEQSRTMTSKVVYSLSAAKTYRLTLNVAGPQVSTPTGGIQITFRCGSITKQWVNVTDIPNASSFTDYTYDFSPAADGDYAFAVDFTETYPNGTRSFILNRFTVVETVGGSATILDDDFEHEGEASGFTSSLNQGGGVRGFVFSAFAEKLRHPLTQVDR